MEEKREGREGKGRNNGREGEKRMELGRSY